MVLYRAFIPALRILAFEEVHILLHDDILAIMKQYIFRLNDVKFTDGEYHYLYGNMKTIITSFVIFFENTIDNVIKEADKYSQTATRKELIRLMERTIEIHERSQADFLDEYLPVTTPMEQEILNNIEKRYQNFMAEALAFKENLNRLDKPEKVDDFAKQHFNIAIKQMHNVLNFGHGYLGKMLADRVDQIYISLDEILLRLRNNLKEIYKQDQEIKHKLHNELYDKHKEKLALSRSYNSHVVENVDLTRPSHSCRESLGVGNPTVLKSIDIIRNKLESYKALPVTVRLEVEVVYWSKKVAEAEELRTIIVRLKKEQEDIVKQGEIYKDLKTTEYPGTKQQCFHNMGDNFAHAKVYLDEKMVEASRAMITLFCCKGNDDILYEDNIGQFFMDDYSHQVYIKDHFMDIYHVNCDGGFKNVREEAYYYDKCGRYIIDKEDGGKTYRCAPCTSHYRMMDNGLLGKITKDCGHSEKNNSKCRMQMQDLTKVEILPMTEPVDIKHTLEPEVVRYLWDTFGAILPAALRDVGVLQSKNPIHHFAHMLLAHKHSKTRQQLRSQHEEAQQYRADILKGREERAIAASKAWKAVQVKRRKPEESDDTMDWHVYEQHLAHHEFINSLDYYN